LEGGFCCSSEDVLEYTTRAGRQTVVFLSELMKRQTIFAHQSTEESQKQLSEAVQRLLKEYQKSYLQAQEEPEEAVIYVDEIASKVAAFYEKIRGIIDWKEEHLIRRTAIQRVLKRRLLSELSGLSLIANLRAEDIAEPLVLELIRGGHFPNGKIPRQKLTEVQRVLEKYIYLLRHALPNNGTPFDFKAKVNLYSWLLEIAACEIEEVLDPPVRENALMEMMTSMLEERIRLDPRLGLSEEEKKIQIYIAVHRALFHLDAPIISYHLLKWHFPQWTSLTPTKDEEVLRQIASSILALRQQIEEELNHPLASEFFNLSEKYDALFVILDDVLQKLAAEPAKMAEKIAQAEVLKRLIEESYARRLATLKSRLFRMAIYSTLSVFVAGGFSLFVVEVPLARLFYGRFSPLAVAVDILVPTLLMFLLVAMTKPPPPSNLERLIKEINKIVYQQKKKDVYEIKKRQRRSFLSFLVGMLYFLGSVLSLGLTILVFYAARVPPTSVILDTLNVAVIVFAAVVIRQRAKELTVEERTKFWEFSLDILAIPIAKIGQWLSAKWKEYNVVSVFFSALVDMPFATLVEFIEDWSTFLKEKKAEIH